MGLKNLNCFYKIIHGQHNQGRMTIAMPETMKEATHALLQRGDSMWIRDPVHPPAVCDMTNSYDTYAKVFRSNSKGGTVSTSHVQTEESAIS